MRLASHCPGPGAVSCNLLMAAWKSAQMWIFIGGGSLRHLLKLRAHLLCSPTSRASPTTYNLASTTCLLVPRYVFRVYHSGSRNAMLATMGPSLVLSRPSRRTSRWVRFCLSLPPLHPPHYFLRRGLCFLGRSPPLPTRCAVGLRWCRCRCPLLLFVRAIVSLSLFPDS